MVDPQGGSRLLVYHKYLLRSGWVLCVRPTIVRMEGAIYLMLD